MFDSLKPVGSIGRRLERTEARLDRMIRGTPSWSDWLPGAGSRPGVWSQARSAWSSLGPNLFGSRPRAERWSGAADRVGASTRAIAEDLVRLGAQAAQSARHRPIGKVVLVAAGLGLLAALARRD
ncbi:hypothetical protein [Blastochloris viridis]|uniref:Uncharacterized protein n=1 Tax=Blastochloris viridis TaxID=1079 RepID=A0A0H5B9B1_BLAVI|nr:hypothetical protein [Blastochloris viridis]ALK07946.1 hypothetical protein BVIR_129 [Blastochloris viridis]BAR98800.1 hypothetical protein BV133_1207 [Blastochloris viridis]CUU43868.1 hypothetical protein BVIRIDIS_28950 [Blastochloris viridis]